MPVDPASITAAILAAAPDLKGPSWVRLATVVGVAVSTWSVVPSNVSLTGVTTGAAGAGAVTGKITIPPDSLPVPTSALQHSLLGLNMGSMARAIGVGVATAFNASAAYSGVSIGVGSGTDVSKITLANGPALVAVLSSVALSQGMVGVHIPVLSSALGLGIATQFLAGTGFGAVAGPVGPAPGVGTSISQVL